MPVFCGLNLFYTYLKLIGDVNQKLKIYYGQCEKYTESTNHNDSLPKRLKREQIQFYTV